MRRRACFLRPQLCVISIDPVDYRLMINREQATDAAKAVAFEVELESHRFGLVVVAGRMRLRRVLAEAKLTLIALAARAIEPAFHLSLAGLAVWASLHVESYNTIRSDLDRSKKTLT